MGGRLRARLARHSVRVRLTALYGVLFLACGAGLLGITYVLVDHGSGKNVLTFSDTTSQTVIALLTGDNPPAAAGKAGHSVSVSGPQARSAPPGAPKTVNAIRKLAEAQQTDLLNRLLLDSGIALGVMAVLACGLGWVVAGRTLRPLETTLVAQRQFVANASHELRTPLARQRAIGQVALADPEADAASLRAAHERVLAAGAQQERLIGALLALARGQAGVDHVRSLDLGAVVARAVAHRQAESELRGLVLAAELADAPFRGDPRLVESLVGNLLDNAVRHNADGGWIDVSTALHEGRAVLTISSSGPVVDPEEVPRLLEPFRRRDARRAVLDVPARDGGGLVVSVGFPAAPARSSAYRGRPGRSGRTLDVGSKSG